MGFLIILICFLSSCLPQIEEKKSLYLETYSRVLRLDSQTNIDDLIISIDTLFNSNLIEPKITDFRGAFFMEAKKTLLKIKNQKPETRVILFKTISNSVNLLSKNTYNFSDENYKILLGNEKMIADITGNYSYIHMLLFPPRIYSLLLNFPDRDFSNEIDNTIANFEKLFGKDNPELANVYFTKCLNLTNQKKWERLHEESIKVQKIIEKHAKKEHPEVYVTNAYLFVSLVELKKFDNAKIIFDNFSPKEISLEDERNDHLNYLIHNSASKMHLNFGKFDHAISSKETSLALAMRYFSKNKDLIKKEAIELRDIFLKINDWKSINNLEARLNLEPLPKNKKQ